MLYNRFVEYSPNSILLNRGVFMFIADKPIKKLSDDKLNRKYFTKQLAQAILSYNSKDNFTIGLYGKWGSGKSSIINMLIEEITRKTSNSPERPIIVRFNPWNYSNTDQLIRQFFNTIMSEIKIKSSGKELKKVGSALEKYSEIFEYSQYIPGVGKYLRPIKALIKGLGSNALEISNQKNNLDSVKVDVVNALMNQNQKIIIIIDDIDRLNNEQIRLIFQLVNCVADFPNMIYLLSFDKSVVVRALEDEQKCNGEEYLEKIIQVPFDVPEAKRTDVHKLLFDQLNNLWFNEIPCSIFDNEYWSNVYSECLSPLLNSIRDVNRVMNVYRFKYEFLHSETNCIDLLAITTLQIFAPNIFEWIKNNTILLTGSSCGMGTSSNDQNKRRDEMTKRFERVTDNAEFMLKSLQVIFPNFSWKTGGHYHSGETEEQLRYMQRISCPDRTSLYFNLSLEDVLVPKNTIIESIYDYNSEELDRLFNDLIRNDLISQYAKELNAHVKDIPDDRKRLILKKLLYLQTLSFEDEKTGFLQISPVVYCEECCWSIFKTMDTDKLCSVLKEFIESLEDEEFNILVDIIVQIERSYGHIGESPNNDYRIISEKQLYSLEPLVLSRIEKNSKINFIFKLKSPWQKYWFWKYKSPHSLQTHISEGLKNKNNVPYYLTAHASTWTGAKTHGWGFKQENIEKDISVDKAYKDLLSLKNTDVFLNLPYDIKEISIAFYIWYNSERKEYETTSKEDVDLLIPEWEKQK